MATTQMLIAGNWKMNGQLQAAEDLVRSIRGAAKDDGCEYLVCPPFTALSTVASILREPGSRLSLGAQDCHAAASGAHTGDISVGMLRDIGCQYVIVGHSERRGNHGESDSDVRLKAEAAHAGGLTAIICVGESDQQRMAGTALSTVEAQIVGSLPEGANAVNTVIAYEPVWAIGTGKTPTLEQISEMHIHMQSVLKDRISDSPAASLRLLYGGSVNPGNAAEILKCQGVDGALIGGASLEADSFLAIGRSCP